jgi:hypothetical protein
MKRAAIMAFALAVVTAYAQVPKEKQPFESQMNRRLNLDKYLAAQESQPNVIARGNVSCSGIAVEAVKTGRPLQLINPFAPPKYAPPEDNVLRDGITKRVLGLKIFSFNF